jgi:hypothetical protein
MTDARRAPRLVVNAPAVVESIGHLTIELPPNLARVFRRAESDQSSIGTKFPAIVRDLSTNGAFIAGVPLPLLARVAVKFDLLGVGMIDTIGWVMWQRLEDCELPSDAGPAKLPRGFGLLFEAISMEARTAIAEHVRAGS